MKTWREVRSNIKSLNEAEKEEIQNAVQLIATLVETREKMGLSQKEIAIRSGVRQPAIARMEKCGVMPRIDTISKIANSLGLELCFVEKNKAAY